ncbi:MAG: PilN domain-containing protein [Candidatus Pacebacteria bacterium]|nr:PilN domain-containing protein [Candidatus Paceibacterota bacterium]
MSHHVTAININLLPSDPFFATPLGRMLRWALSAGRYIVIFTELIVIISFAARFTLDRQLTDLNKEISQKKAIVLSYGELEKNVRNTQTKIANYDSFEQDANLAEVFEKLSIVTPTQVALSRLGITSSAITIEGSAPSQSVFNILITNLQLSPDFSAVTVSKVESADKNVPGLVFTLAAQTKKNTNLEAKTKKP